MARKMRSSGIEWIGEIPEDWEVIRVKNAALLKARIGWQGLRSDEFLYEPDLPLLVTGTDFAGGVVNWNNCVRISEKRFEMDKNIQVKENDLLITKDGTIGKLAIARNCPEKVSLNSGVFVIRNQGPYKYFDKYMYYLLQSEQFLLWFELNDTGNSTIRHLYQKDFYNFSFTYPPLEEQEKIADYLDKKTNQIEQIKTAVKQEIQTLEDYKKSVITEAVTKGLDKNTAMKDSRIEWIGGIPKHWEVKRMKQLLSNRADSLKVGPFGSALKSSDLVDDGKWVYNQRAVLDNNFNDNDTFINDKKFAELKGFKVNAGDVLLTTRGTIGRVAIVPDHFKEGVIHPCIIKFRLSKDVFKNELIRFIFNDTDIVLKQVEFLSNSTTIGVIYSYNLVNIYVPTPPISEQNQIVEYLDKKCTLIDDAIAGKQKQLETLDAYKKSLIYEYVTGKKEVAEC